MKTESRQAVSGAPDADADARRRALDPTRSFIVQAPAGSGKTTLLTQRYLSLLAHATRPEEILAITFTRKAAAEMRGRVLEALEGAAAGTEPRNANEARTRPLALAALAQDRREGWGLLDEPGRLRMQTFDALNQWLAGRLPVLSGAGAAPTVSVEPGPLYEAAARRTLSRLEEDGEVAGALGALLGWLDNELPRLVDLIASMLGTREHWLRHVATGEFALSPIEVREYLEESLASVVRDGLLTALRAWPAASRRGALSHLRHAASRMREDPAWQGEWREQLAHCEDLVADPAQFPLWSQLLTLLLTTDSEWRKTVTKNQGFPADKADKEPKRAMLEYLGELAQDDALLTALRAVRRLPPPRYTDAQWQALRSIVVVLAAAAAELEVVFAEHGEVDFIAVSRAALHALGQEAEPSDFALRLDYRLRHLLVDEFQDTSAGQVALLERLTEGFMPGDGRTLFCVGDPMQSVYRFREADVALFLKVRDHGLGPLHLESLVLERNFRSQPALVDWVNATFSIVFPRRDDLRVGAVRHARATARDMPATLPGVYSHPLPGADPLAEGVAVARLVARLRTQQPEARIAVIGRARAHLSPVARALGNAGIAYQGLALVRLKDRLAVRDLVSLTRAVCHLGDRDAWLACLHAPFTGLCLADLHALLGGDQRRTVRDLATDPQALAVLDADSRARVQRTVELLDAARADRGRRSLAACVESLWLELGAPATLADAADLDNARAFFARLDELDEGGDLPDPVALETQLQELYAAPDPAADDKLQLMTIHYAKGLEWDIVVLVGLGRGVAADRARLLHWQRWERPDEGPALVLAPVRARAQQEDPITSWLAGMERARDEHELKRVLYVAATRAIAELHLVGSLPVDEEGRARAPLSRSALSLLAPALGPDWSGAVDTAAAASESEREPDTVAGERRLASGWLPPPAPAGLGVGAIAGRRAEQPEFVWVSEPARHAGTVVHEELARRATGAGAPADTARWLRRLRELGLHGEDLEAARARVVDAVRAIDTDARGRWLLDPHHEQAACELALSGVDGGEVVSVVIDRTFIDAGTRWIVDYKTSTHEGAGREAFLDEQARRYRDQLERYARLMSRLDPAHPVRLGLYFPLLGGWREWTPAPA